MYTLFSPNASFIHTTLSLRRGNEFPELSYLASARPPSVHLSKQTSSAVDAVGTPVNFFGAACRTEKASKISRDIPRSHWDELDTCTNSRPRMHVTPRAAEGIGAFAVPPAQTVVSQPLQRDKRTVGMEDSKTFQDWDRPETVLKRVEALLACEWHEGTPLSHYVLDFCNAARGCGLLDDSPESTISRQYFVALLFLRCVPGEWSFDGLTPTESPPALDDLIKRVAALSVNNNKQGKAGIRRPMSKVARFYSGDGGEAVLPGPTEHYTKRMCPRQDGLGQRGLKGVCYTCRKKGHIALDCPKDAK